MSLFSNLLPAIGQLIGGPIGGQFGTAYSNYTNEQDARHGQELTNAQNVALAREQMQFQERMSSTAYQRATDDMTKAGLNPMLAYSQGGASSPAGTTPSVQNAVGTGISSANQHAQTLASLQSLQNNQAQIELTQATKKKIESETLTNELNSARATAELNLTGNRGDLAGWEAVIKKWASARELLNLNFDKETYENRVTGVGADTETKQLEAQRRAGTFEDDVKLRKAQAEAERLGLSEAGATSKFAEETGAMPKYLRLILQILSSGHSARRFIP